MSLWLVSIILFISGKKGTAEKMEFTIPEEHRFRIHQTLSTAGIPDGEICFLAKGANSHIYKIFNDNVCTVAKVGVNKEFTNLDKEFLFLKETSGIGPETVAFSFDHQYKLQTIIESFIDGYHPYEFNSEELYRIGRKISQYHSIQSEQLKFSRETWKDFLSNRICSIKSLKDELSINNKVLKFIDTLHLKGNSIYYKYEPRRPVLIHGDLIPLNILVDSNKEIRIIDWESVRYDDPESDLATLIKAFHIHKDQLPPLLEGYHNDINMEILWFRLLLHYMQVVCWRITVQLPASNGLKKEEAVAEVTDELSFVQNLLDSHLSWIT